MPRKKVLKFKPVNALIPISLGNLDEMFKGSGLDTDRMRAILHQCYASKLLETANPQKHDTAMYQDGWFPLRARFLDIIYPKKYVKYLEWLENNGILFPNRNEQGGKSYSQNRHCTYYRFNPQLLSKPLTNRHYRKELITSQRTLKSISILIGKGRECLQINRNRTPLEYIHHQLLQMLKQINFDVDRAEEFITKVKSGEVIVRETKNKKPRPYGDYLELMIAINESRAPLSIVDLFGERLYTPITNLWKELRQFVYFKDNPNERLVELDIANSQPYFSSICLQPDVMEKLLPEFAHCIPLLRNYSNNENLLLYQKLNRNGQIYEHWMNARKMDRNTAKLDFLANVMFSRVKPRKPETKEARKIFKHHFPVVDYLFGYIKKLSEKELPFIVTTYTDKHGRFQGRKSYFKNLSCAMQRAESRLFIKRICPALIQNGIPRFLTIHDSILVEPAYAEKALERMKNEFVKLGVEPPLIRMKQY